MNLLSGPLGAKLIDRSPRGSSDGFERGASPPDAAFQDVLDNTETATSGATPVLATISKSDLTPENRSAARFAALFIGDASMASSDRPSQAAEPSVGQPASPNQTIAVNLTVSAGSETARQIATPISAVAKAGVDEHVTDFATQSKSAAPSEAAEASEAEPISVASEGGQTFGVDPIVTLNGHIGAGITPEVDLAQSVPQLSGEPSAIRSISLPTLPSQTGRQDAVLAGNPPISDVAKVTGAKPARAIVVVSPVKQIGAKGIGTSTEDPRAPVATSVPEAKIPSLSDAMTTSLDPKPMVAAAAMIARGTAPSKVSPAPATSATTPFDGHLQAVGVAESGDNKSVRVIGDHPDPLSQNSKTLDGKPTAVDTSSAGLLQVHPSQTSSWMAPRMVEAGRVEPPRSDGTEKGRSRFDALPAAATSVVPPASTSPTASMAPIVEATMGAYLVPSPAMSPVTKAGAASGRNVAATADRSAALASASFTAASTAPTTPTAKAGTDADLAPSLAEPPVTRTDVRPGKYVASNAERSATLSAPSFIPAPSAASSPVVDGGTSITNSPAPSPPWALGKTEPVVFTDAAQTSERGSIIEVQTYFAPAQVEMARPQRTADVPTAAPPEGTAGTARPEYHLPTAMPVFDAQVAATATSQAASARPLPMAFVPTDNDLPVPSDPPQSPTLVTHDDAHIPLALEENKTVASPRVDPASSPAAIPVRTPADQVAKTITDAIAEPARSVRVPDEAVQPKIARTMILQLSPANLGTVNVRMHLAGGALDLQLEVSDPKALNLLTRDRDTLSKALRSEAYDLGSLAIRASDAASATSNSTSRDQASASNNQASNGQGSADQRQSNSTNGERPAYRRAAPQEDSTRDDKARRPGDSRAGSLYL